MRGRGQTTAGAHSWKERERQLEGEEEGRASVDAVLCTFLDAGCALLCCAALRCAAHPSPHISNTPGRWSLLQCHRRGPGRSPGQTPGSCGWRQLPDAHQSQTTRCKACAATLAVS
jgi:hypothetical protein